MKYLKTFEMNSQRYLNKEEIEDYLMKWIDNGELEIENLGTSDRAYQEILHERYNDEDIESDFSYIYINSEKVDDFNENVDDDRILQRELENQTVYLRALLPSYGGNTGHSFLMTDYTFGLLQDYFENFVRRCGFKVDIAVKILNDDYYDNELYDRFMLGELISASIVKIKFM